MNSYQPPALCTPAGIRESNEKHIRVGTRTTTERVFRQPAGPPSLCRWGGYWVDVPRTRTVVETYSATVYCLRPDEIANHFIGERRRLVACMLHVCVCVLRVCMCVCVCVCVCVLGVCCITKRK